MPHGVIFSPLQIGFFFGRESLLKSPTDGLERPKYCEKYDHNYPEQVLFAHSEGCPRYGVRVSNNMAPTQATYVKSTSAFVKLNWTVMP